MTVSTLQNLPGVMVLCDDDPRWKRDPVEQALAACQGGARSIQLRVKHATDRQQLEWAERIRSTTREHGCLFFINDRFDLAVCCEADGVHLGQDDLPPGEIPEPWRERLIIGRSTHDPAQLRAAREEPVDYIAYGPVFTTESKEIAYAARGLEALRHATELVAPVPLVAIGGIDTDNAAAVRRAGASAIAVISAVTGADDPEQATRRLAQAFDRGDENSR